MDHSEQLARQYLQSLGSGRVEFEPDGNVPPDFLLDGRVAVEVRRLNQNHGDAAGYEGLETAKAATVRHLRKLLPRFGAAPDGEGYWVFVHFRRPLDWKAVKRALPRALKAFKASPSTIGQWVRLTSSFQLEIRPADGKVVEYFMLGACDDRDQGGFVVAEIIRNLNLCIAEKVAKVAPYRDRYSEWWLVLSNNIDPDLDPDEHASVGEHVDVGVFDRVVLIDPRDPSRALVLAQRVKQI